MSKCNYQATINKIETITCDYDFITNENGEKIVHYVDKALEYNFRSPFEINYLVDTQDPVCEISEKSKYHAVIKPSSDVINSSVTDEAIYSATFSQPIYSAEIQCSSVNLESIHVFLASGKLLAEAKSGAISIQVSNQSDFKVGHLIAISSGANIEEERTIVSVGPLTLNLPLEHDHLIDSKVTQIKNSV